MDNWKHAPIWRAARELLGAGAIGTVRELSLSVLRPPGSGGGDTGWRRDPAVAGGGILLDHGWHQLYLALGVLGARPSAVRAQMSFADDGAGRYEDTVDLTLELACARAHLHLTWCAERRETFGKVIGSDGELTLADDHLVVTSLDAPPRRVDFDEALSASSQHVAWMAPVIDAFSRELAEQGERGRNLEEAGLITRIIDEAYRACTAPVPA